MSHDATTHRHHSGLLIYVSRPIAQSPDFPFSPGDRLTATIQDDQVTLTKE